MIGILIRLVHRLNPSMEGISREFGVFDPVDLAPNRP